MKFFAISILASALFLTTANAALAEHGATTTPAPVPLHGSIWFGSGLERYGTDALALSIPEPVHGIAEFGAGVGH